VLRVQNRLTMLTPASLLGFCLLVVACVQNISPTKTQSPPGLEGGVAVLGEDAYAAFSVPANPAVNIEPITAVGQAFDQAWRVTAVRKLEQPYFAQLSAKNSVAISKNDVMVVEFWARRISAAAKTEFVFELGSDPYTKSLALPLRLKPEWTQYRVAFQSLEDYAIDQARAHFRLGYDPQIFELGGVVLKNYAQTKRIKDFPLLGLEYAGREESASWRTAAAQRIENLRKASLRVKVTDASGNPVSGATVKLEMQRHAFAFGSAVDARRLLGSSSDSQKYREAIDQLFNRVVLENDLKWGSWDTNYFPKSRSLEALQYFRDRSIGVRGHNLVWPTWEHLPSDVKALENDPVALKKRISDRIADIVTSTKGQLVDWDVINEPSSNKDLQKILGEDEMANWIKQTRSLDDKARLFINDYGNLGECCELETELKRIVKRMQDLNAPIGGIGLQAHFGYLLTPPEELYERLNDLGSLGLPLEITEFDINIKDEQLQADYQRDFMTIIFSHPKVSGFLMWGFWAGQHWLPDGALFDANWNLKPVGQAFRDLVFKTWWTNVSGSSDANGAYNARGFMGDYKITASANGKTVSQNVKLEPNSGEFVLKLP
jgi:endo-1,4-beta-xylanase